MASKPGILTDWPWKPLGNFKYVILAPWAIHGTYSFIAKGESERDLGYFLIFPFLLARMLHNQIWISLSRYRTAKGNNRIVDKGIEFEQVDRETTWDDQILFNGAIFYIGYMALPQSHNLPLWKSNGVIITALLHAGPVEFLYYWFHRALHHHFLYSRYHSHHHSSIVTEPITSVVHPFAEHIVYFMLFTIPLLTTVLTRTASIASFAGYITFIDFMNNLGHCNFELIPKWLFSIFPPLKYLIYTPSFHSLHHTQFRTNYSLFMPLYDYVYGTMDKSTDTLYEASLKRPEESPDVVHLTHLTTPESIYHLRLGFASLASWPYSSKWYLRLLWPVTLFWSVIISGIYGHAFVLERITFKALKLQSWLVPRYNIQETHRYMASKPGILTDWPWKPLGKFKYVILAPWAIHGTYSFIAKGESERDLGYFLIFPFLLARMLHNQIWISLSRYRTAKGNNRIVDKGIEFEQVDRETTWDDQILFNGAIFYIGYMALPQSHNLPLWKSNGVIITALLHAGPVEFLYYWFHRALHHHFLYSRYHSHHHSSIVTEPITSVVHPFAEHIVYFMLFTIPLLTTVLTRTASIASFAGYITFIDFMNNLGHCNFELIPKWLFSIFPPLKYLIYTPSFHSLHHTQFRTNYSLFMPLYDYVYGTMDKSTDTLYEASLKRPEESPDVVHLTHLTTPESIYHLRLGFASLASWPYSSKWYLRLLWPVTLFWSVIISGIYGHAFVLERITFKALKLQSWLVPRYNIQYMVQWQSEALNTLIEEAILDAEVKGVKVLSLGLLNQGEEMNRNGELYIKRYPQLKIRLVDGSSLVVALVLNSIPKGTTQVLLRGKLSKVACAIADALCESGIQVAILYNDEYEKLRLRLTTKSKRNLVISTSFTDQKIWLVGDRWTEDQEQHKAPKGTLFIPFSQFPPKKLRKDCFYQATPAMIAPTSLISNMHSCENWLPRRVMSAWRIAGILHALEGWNVHECGNTMFDIDKVWQASLRHGFRPLATPAVA